MSAGHHGGPIDDNAADIERQNELMKRFIEQAEGKAKRTYGQGRIGAEDDGDLALAIAADREKGIVLVSFGKPVEWIGLGPREAVALAKTLVDKARLVSKEPLVMTF
jgi:hypothetical protein